VAVTDTPHAVDASPCCQDGEVTATPESTTVERPDADEVVMVEPPWITLVWDDPVNLMSYVTFVFVEYFHYSKGKAQKLMMQVHTEGKAVVATGSREEMERDVQAMHSYGLWATLQRSDQP
jgi:ATP-dependent Clp protease adaptor protein ClpS